MEKIRQRNAVGQNGVPNTWLAPKIHSNTQNDYIQNELENGNHIRVAELYIRDGFTIDQIVKETGLSRYKVQDIVEKASLKQEANVYRRQLTSATLKDKVPLMRDIVDLSLNSLKEYLVELSDPNIRATRLKSIADASALAKIATTLNETLRLELGEATQNIQVTQYSYEQAQVILKDLSKKDLIFDYPVNEEET